MHVRNSPGFQLRKWEFSTCVSTRNYQRGVPAPPGSVCEGPRALGQVKRPRVPAELPPTVPLQGYITERAAFCLPRAPPTPPQEEGSLVDQICLSSPSPSGSPGPRLTFDHQATSLGPLRREQTLMVRSPQTLGRLPLSWGGGI